MSTLIAHLDADCFYVSAERVRDSFLDGKAVGVLGNQGACVIAKSYEMKAAGVKTGEPIWDAVVKCPNGLYLKRDFHWYEVVSREMLSIVREWSPLVEYYSVDEFFLSVPSESPLAFAERIRDRILESVGVPVTIGIARTKTLAKLISDSAKPFGAVVLDRDAERELLASRPVEDITGIGGRRATKLGLHGIKTCLDFALASPSLIRKLLTVVGEKLCYELNGERCLPIVSNRPPHKMISRGGSIGKPTDDEDVQWAWAVRNLERLIEAMEYHVVQAGKLTLILEYKNGPTAAADASLVPTDRSDLLLEAARYLWSKVHYRGRLYRMHYIAGELQYAGMRQLGLFDPPPERDRAIRSLRERIRDKRGRFALRSAATLPLVEIYRDYAHDYDICDIYGKTCF